MPETAQDLPARMASLASKVTARASNGMRASTVPLSVGEIAGKIRADSNWEHFGDELDYCGAQKPKELVKK